jgi:transcriptional regulator with XRE-family HTH domain
MSMNLRKTARRLLGERIQQRRAELEITQSELAKRVQLRQQAISDIEAGKQAIPADELPLWAEALCFKTILSFYEFKDRYNMHSLGDLMD